ncbi:MAG: pirin family protein [Myxococcales bacterium]
MSMRSVKRLHPAVRDDIGDLQTRRPLPGATIEQLDPFLFLNHHGPQTYGPHNGGLPFGPHPHRGFETVTFILAGELAHLDSGGHESVIREGGVQWMTAGSGLVHAEISPQGFLEAGGPLEILQLWVNLPARLKLVKPRYVGLQRSEVPSVRAAGATLDVIAGDFLGQRGPIESLTGVAMATLALQPGARIVLPAPRGRSVFFYVVRGEVGQGRAGNLVELNDDGDEVEIDSGAGALVLFGHADPIGEPVVAQGPFVMNTRTEIVQAIRDYQAGKFGAVPL